MISPEHWRFEAAPERTARDRRGRIIPHFHQHFTKLVAAAKQIAPHENAEAFAMRSLNVDRRAVRLETLRFDAVFNGDAWAVTMSNASLAPKEIGLAANLPLAFKAVDDWRQARAVAAEPPPERVVFANDFHNRRRFRRRRRPLPV
jgi:hypothetical protein